MIFLHKINYEIPFDKLNKEGIKETIIHIKEIGTEISIDNDIITYIKRNIHHNSQSFDNLSITTIFK